MKQGLSKDAVQAITSTYNGLADRQMTVEDYIDYFYPGKDSWTGDMCGCPDDRCIGYHHEAGDSCGCLNVKLEELHDELAKAAQDRLPDHEVCVCPPFALCPVHSLDRRNDLELQALREQLERIVAKFRGRGTRTAREVVVACEADLVEIRAEIVSRLGD